MGRHASRFIEWRDAHAGALVGGGVMPSAKPPSSSSFMSVQNVCHRRDRPIFDGAVPICTELIRRGRSTLHGHLERLPVIVDASCWRRCGDAIDEVASRILDMRRTSRVLLEQRKRAAVRDIVHPCCKVVLPAAMKLDEVIVGDAATQSIAAAISLTSAIACLARRAAQNRASRQRVSQEHAGLRLAGLEADIVMTKQTSNCRPRVMRRAQKLFGPYIPARGMRIVDGNDRSRR